MFITKSVEPFNGFGNNALRNFISGSGQAVTYDTALLDPTVKACVRVIAQTISTLPLQLFKKQNNAIGKQWQLDESSLMSYILTVRPNVRQTSVEFVEQLITQLMIFSEYYAQVRKAPSGKITGIIPFNSPKQVSVREHGEGLIYDCVTNDGRSISLNQDEILHIRDLSVKTYEALDKVHLAKSSIGLSLSATKNAEQYYKKGSRAGGFIQVSGKLSDEAFTRLTNQVNESFGGEDNAHRIGILENDSKYVQNPYSLKDAQVLESREAAIREIAAIFGVPLPLLGISDANMKDPEAINAFFYKSCLQSIINKIEARFRLILPRDYALKFDTSEYLKGDIKATAEVAEKLFTRGLISRSEARKRVGHQPDMQEDIFVVSSNNLIFGTKEDFLNPDIQKQNSTTLNTEVQEDESKEP
ncbi:phage portal protein [Vibrio parahaemolyticus]|nr:phage portal protein [Vibrio parahaemolyticus]EHU0344305.1 phage portal protein [Vibrio parahaemolyticus]EHU0354339.1 phage portal protein [Vibrio parahaemolyticus]